MYAKVGFANSIYCSVVIWKRAKRRAFHRRQLQMMLDLHWLKRAVHPLISISVMMRFRVALPDAEP